MPDVGEASGVPPAQSLRHPKGVRTAMPNFASQGAFSITKEPFSDWEKGLRRAAKTVHDDISKGVHGLMRSVEQDLRAAAKDHPSWPASASLSAVHDDDGIYSVVGNDEAAAAEYGRDPLTPGAPIVAAMGATRAHEMDEKLKRIVLEAVQL